MYFLKIKRLLRKLYTTHGLSDYMDESIILFFILLFIECMINGKARKKSVNTGVKMCKNENIC